MQTSQPTGALFRGKGSNRPMITLAASHPEKILPESLVVLKEPEGARGDAVSGTLDYLPDRDWPRLVEAALTAFAQDPANQVSRRILSAAYFQAPEAFHPHLSRIFFEMEPFLKSFSPGVWRGSGDSSLTFLQPVLGNFNSQNHRQGIEILQNTHDPEMLLKAHYLEQALDSHFFWSYALNRFAYTAYYEIRGECVHLLYPRKAWQLHFSEGYINPRKKATPLHPTWRVPEEMTQRTSQFGGIDSEDCPRCGRALQHILTLDPPPSGLGVSGLSKLVLSVCTNHRCLGLGVDLPTYYHHGADGRPMTLDTDPEEVAFPLPFIAQDEVRLINTPARWKWQDSNSRWANLNRLGGLPSWVQDPGHPQCPECGGMMSFLMQLDSGMSAYQGEYLSWCSGLLFTFWCDRCKISAFFRQCT